MGGDHPLDGHRHVRAAAEMGRGGPEVAADAIGLGAFHRAAGRTARGQRERGFIDGEPDAAEATAEPAVQVQKPEMKPRRRLDPHSAVVRRLVPLGDLVHRNPLESRRRAA